MKKSDEQLAQELDLFLTARLQGKTLPPVSDELSTDIAFVEELLEVSAQSESEQFFFVRPEGSTNGRGYQRTKKQLYKN